MLKEFLKTLVCPAPECRKPLEIISNGTELRCTNCGKTFPVQNGVPLLVEAQVIQ